MHVKNCLKTVIYGMGVIYVLVNLFVLLNRKNTRYYLRLYHLAVGVAMLICNGLMLSFMLRACLSKMSKLSNPHTIPRPTLISAFLLTAGIILGYAYLLVFNIAFSNCDLLTDATSVDEQWQEAIYSILMIGFCLLTLIYILQRSYYGALDCYFDLVIRQFVNVVLTIVWIKIVIFKGYLNYQELCQRKEISGYWCPIVKKLYQCEPEEELNGTQKIWYYLHKGLLSNAVISCASEFFPVMLVGHWLASGKAEERADELIRKQEEKKSVCRILHSLMGNVSQVCGINKQQNTIELSPLKISNWLKYLLGFGAWFTGFIAIIRWGVGFYFAINFDFMHKIGSMIDNFTELGTSCVQLCLFALVYKWSLTVEQKRFDAHHKAESRGDLILLAGSASFMSVKLLLQILELNFQRTDGFLKIEECLIRISSLIIIHISSWLQYLCLRHIMALHCEDIYATRLFLPSVALCSIMINWVGFGITFFETNLIKYKLSKPEFYFSATTLICMIFTQTIYPADYLFMFTAAGCWTDVLLRYFEMGLFELGTQVLSVSAIENTPQNSPKHNANITENILSENAILNYDLKQYKE